MEIRGKRITAAAALAVILRAKDEESVALEQQITLFTWFAFILVAGASVASTIGICHAVCGILTLGELGNYLSGAVGAPFSLAGLLFVYIAFLGQKRQSLTQDKQIAQTTHQLTIDRLDTELLNIEQTFYRLLQRHADVADSLRLKRRDPTSDYVLVAEGRDCFEVLFGRFREQLSAFGNLDDRRLIVEQYALFFERHQAILSLYFTQLLQIVQYLHSGGEPDLTRRLAGFLHAELSRFELLLRKRPDLPS